MKRALVTGGTKGIGKAIVQDLLGKGYTVIINYANDDVTANLTYHELIERHPGHISMQKEYLGGHENTLAFCEKIKKITPQLDVLVLNAGQTDRDSFGQTVYQNWLSVFETNLFAPYFIIQELHPIMPQGSAIIFTGSSMGLYPHSLSVSYGVSKAGVHALVKNLVKFLAPFKIRINAIAPGFVDTDWQTQKPEWLKEKIKNKIALHRFCTPQEVSAMAMQIIENDYLNGEIIHLDGGYDFE